MLLASSFTNLFDAPKSITSIFPLVWKTPGCILFSLALKYMMNCTGVVKCHLANRGVSEPSPGLPGSDCDVLVLLGVTVLSPKHSRVRFTFRAFCANVRWIFPV